MLTIDLASTLPLHDQIVRLLRHTVATGKLTPGDTLPAVRQLAADLGINFNTVARAYRALENLGLVRTARGRGTTVVAVVEGNQVAAAITAHEALRTALTDARLAGLSRDQVAALLEQETSLLWPEYAQEDTHQ